MLTTTPERTTVTPGVRRRRPAGFTLVEVLTATVLGGLLMAAVLSSFAFVARGSVNAGHYATMEQQARGALEQFGRDVRMARYLTTVSAREVRLTVPQVGSNADDTISYVYDATARTLSRVGPDPVTRAMSTRVLARDVATCDFRRWLIGSAGPASSDAATDQLQIRLTLSKQARTAATTTNVVVSARFVLRNHRSNTAL